MIKGICIPKGMIEDQSIQNLLLNKNLSILIRDEKDYLFYKNNKSNLIGSMCENSIYKVENPELIPYYDEPISTPHPSKLSWIVNKLRYKNTIIGELENFELLYGHNITYTAYQDLWFNFFGLRVYKWWTNQIKTLDDLQSKYKNKLVMIWIHLIDNEKDFDVLNGWGITYNKNIWYYTPDGITKQQLINQINKL